jgi:hypothetical protein
MMRHMQTNSDTSTTGHTTRHGEGKRYNIPEAAKVLGLTEEAVRQRVKRGTLNSIKVDGKLFVLLESDVSTNTSSDQGQLVIDTSTDTSRLVDALESEVTHLRRQLEQANERDRENRRIIAALTSRIPELLPGSMPEPREASETVTEGAAKDHLPPKPEQRRSWLHRFFFGP